MDRWFIDWFIDFQLYSLDCRCCQRPKMNQGTVLSMRSVVVTHCLKVPILLSSQSFPVSTTLGLFNFREYTTRDSKRFVAHVEFMLKEEFILFVVLKGRKSILFTGRDVRMECLMLKSPLSWLQVCPMLDKGEGNTYACCSINQLLSLEESLGMSKAVLNRCPSCAENFAHLHCINTCSPQQTKMIQVTKVMNVTGPDNITRDGVVGYAAFLSTTFADAAFQSCKNVRIPATGGFAISTMCGRYGAKLCNPQRWYDFQGDSSNGLAPLDIDFHLVKPGSTEELPEGIVPYSGNARKCNETLATEAAPCSCQDCAESCPKIPSPALPAGPFQLLGIDGFLAIGVILLCLLIFAFLFYLVVAYLMRRNSDKKKKSKHQRKDKNSNEVIGRIIDPSEVTCADKNSQLAQDFLSSQFQVWGTVMATYPLTVSFHIWRDLGRRRLNHCSCPLTS